MKTHKIIISTLALAMGAALAGSVSGTVAWFQYATRAQVSYIGTSGHCSELLQVSLDDGATWKSEFATADLQSNSLDLAHKGTNVVPITSGPVEMDDDLGDFYANPIYQISAGDYTHWTAADAHNYLQFTLKFRVIDVNDNYDATAADQSGADYLAKNVYLTDLTLEAADANNDLGDALRVHLATSAGDNFLIANTATSTDTEGELDLNGDGDSDLTEGYEWTTGRTAITYGDGQQTSYAKSAIVATDNNGAISDGTVLGVTDDDEFAITVTVWLEGWQELNEGVDGNANTIWNSSEYVGVEFHVGMRFAVPLHDNAAE